MWFQHLVRLVGTFNKTNTLLRVRSLVDAPSKSIIYQQHCYFNQLHSSKEQSPFGKCEMGYLFEIEEIRLTGFHSS